MPCPPSLPHPSHYGSGKRGGVGGRVDREETVGGRGGGEQGGEMRMNEMKKNREKNYTLGGGAGTVPPTGTYQ